MASIPALEPPPGVTPNFVNPYNQNKVTITLISVCLPATTLFLLIRMYSKVRLIKSHGWEDYTSLMAWIGFIALSAVRYKCMKLGGGYHQWDVTALSAMDWVKWVNIEALIYTPTSAIAKISILLMYLRIFMPNRRGITYYITQFILWFYTLFSLALLILTILQCVPRRKMWKPWVQGKCLDIQVILFITSIVNFLSDMSILLLPIGCIWRLQLSLKRKLAISAVFATGFFACVASVMRIVVNINNYHSLDFTYSAGYQAHFMYIELAIGIICGCMPVLPQFFRHFLPRFLKNLGYHFTKVLDYFDRFRSRSTSFHGSEDDKSVAQVKKNRSRFLMLGSSENNGKGLSTIIRAEVPLAERFRSKSESDECLDSENQMGITKTVDIETSSLHQTISG